MNNKNICSKDLKTTLENGILNIDIKDVQSRMEELQTMMDAQNYLAEHNYKIWQGSKGFYYTYLPDTVKGRILLKRKTESDLIDAIVDFYKCHNTVCMLFTEWLEYKKMYRLVKEPSAIRYETDYMRFIYGTDFGNTEVANVTEEMLEKFIISSIFDNNLTAKAFSGLRTIIIGMFKYATINEQI